MIDNAAVRCDMPRRKNKSFLKDTAALPRTPVRKRRTLRGAGMPVCVWLPFFCAVAAGLQAQSFSASVQRNAGQPYTAIAVGSGHSAAVESISYTPDGKFMATGGRDGRVIVWTADDAGGQGRAVRTFYDGAEGTAVRSVSFSPDGVHLVSASDAGILTVRDWERNRVVRSIRTGRLPVTVCAYAPDGRLIAAAGEDALVRLYDAAGGGLVRELRGLVYGAVTGLAWSPDSSFFAVSAADASVKLVETATGRRIRSFAGHTDPVLAVAYSPDGTLAASSGADRRIMLWSVSDGKKRAGIKTAVTCGALAFSADRNWLLAGGNDGAVYVYDVARLSDAGTDDAVPPVRVFSGHRVGIRALQCAPDGVRCAAASADATVSVWRIADGQKAGTCAGYTALVTAAAVSPDGTRLVCGSMTDTALRIFDRKTGRTLGTVPGHEKPVSAATFSADGRYVVSASYDSTVRIYDAETWDFVESAALPAVAQQVAFDPAGDRVVCTSGSDRVFVVSRANTGAAGTVELKHSATAVSALFSPDGRFLVAAAGGYLYVRNPLTMKADRIFTAHADTVHGICFSPDGAYLYSTGSDGLVKVWNTGSWTLAKKITAGDVQPLFVCPAAGGHERIAVSCSDRTLRIINLENGKTERILDCGAGVKLLSYDRQNGGLVCAGYDGVVSLFSLKNHAAAGAADVYLKYSGEKEYAAWTPDGYFDGTARGLALFLHFVYGTQIVMPAAAASDLQRPDIVSGAFLYGCADVR